MRAHLRPLPLIPWDPRARCESIEREFLNGYWGLATTRYTRRRNCIFCVLIFAASKYRPLYPSFDLIYIRCFWCALKHHNDFVEHVTATIVWPSWSAGSSVLTGLNRRAGNQLRRNSNARHSQKGEEGFFHIIGLHQ